MASHPYDKPIPPTDEERRMVRFLDTAFVYTWKASGEGRKLEFASRNPLYEFFDLMMRMGDAGYLLGATLFGRKVAEKNVERTVRSKLMTMLARGLHDAHYSSTAPIKESAIAHIGRFVNALIAVMPDVHVEWAEDMDTDDPKRDLKPEPIAVIRGVFLSPSLDQRNCAKFWELAAASERFPLRIFSEPCAPEDGVIFSSYHRRAFAIVFTIAPEPAVDKFAGHLRRHATRKMVRRQRPGRDEWIVQPEDATENERQNVLRCIAGNVEPHARREHVSALLGVA